MLRHVVMFRFVDGVDPGAVEAMAAALDTLPTRIDTIRRYQHGSDLGLSDANFDYVVVADFDDETGFLTYRDHDAHQELIREHIVGNVATRVAVQYEVAAA
jgi:hypothetical protein